MKFHEACQTAMTLSEDGCVRHVNATILLPNAYRSEPAIDPTGYIISDWYNGATVQSFSDGRPN